MNTSANNSSLTAILSQRLERLYASDEVPALVDQILDAISSAGLDNIPAERGRLWSEDDVILISYGDSVQAAATLPLDSLAAFLEQHLTGVISTLHLLPFFPFSSDDGFAVIDYLQVNSQLGDWDHVERLHRSFNLMFDLVINHVSSEHQWVHDFKAGKPPGSNYFIVPPVDADLSQVVRPRESDLLTTVQTVAGAKQVWSTFSADQIDVDFSNPQLLLEYVRILLAYLKHGARFIRLDAVAFLWKKWETSCLHLPETHEAVRLLRDIVEFAAAGTVLLTETNVPHQQNVSYFGDSDEAHMVYQFSLAPLLLHSLYRGNSYHLTRWARTCCRTPPDCTFLNFTASHDGIGMRPLEGLLPQGEIDILLHGMEQYGGLISYRTHADGTKSAYEINISYFDALKGTWLGQDSWQIARFLLAQTLMLGLRGIPALYIHSLLATENDYEAVASGGRARLINRHKWDAEKLETLLAEGDSNQAIIFNELRRRIKIRRQQKAFHPDGRQQILFLGEHLFCFWRYSLDGSQRILAVHNLTDQERHLYLDGDLDGQLPGLWVGLLTGELVNSGQGVIKLPPYHVLWLAQDQAQA